MGIVKTSVPVNSPTKYLTNLYDHIPLSQMTILLQENFIIMVSGNILTLLTWWSKLHNFLWPVQRFKCKKIHQQTKYVSCIRFRSLLCWSHHLVSLPIHKMLDLQNYEEDTCIKPISSGSTNHNNSWWFMQS